MFLLQRSAEVDAPGGELQDEAYHFSLNLPVAFMQPGASSLAVLCTGLGKKARLVEPLNDLTLSQTKWCGTKSAPFCLGGVHFVVRYGRTALSRESDKRGSVLSSPPSPLCNANCILTPAIDASGAFRENKQVSWANLY